MSEVVSEDVALKATALHLTKLLKALHKTPTKDNVEVSREFELFSKCFDIYLRFAFQNVFGVKADGFPEAFKSLWVKEQKQTIRASLEHYKPMLLKIILERLPLIIDSEIKASLLHRHQTLDKEVKNYVV